MHEMKPRTNTPPAIKWLANEIAVMKGELDRIDAEVAHLAGRRAQVQAVLNALENVSAQVAVPNLSDVVPIVNAHNARYGGRGQFRAWLKASLQAVAPAPLDTATLASMADLAFGLAFETKQARARFIRNTLSRALRAMLDAGEVERLHDYRGMAYRAGIWRWKGSSASTLVELATRAQELR
ncbi:MAG: hypothetical protein K2X75_10535 [Burkholderiaceae bacterium]|nr:hypothetical protein [Burkholderiaceae bacterium]